MAKGTTASIKIAGASITIGAARNTILSAAAGVISSLKMSFNTSAKGWKVPKGPHRLGPILLWNRPMRRLSANTNTAAPISTTFTRINIMTNPATT